MRLNPGSAQTVCPYSGTIAEDGAFTHPDDLKAALKVVEHAFAQDAATAVHDMLSQVARKSSGSITVKPQNRLPSPRPRFRRRDLMRLLICDHCGRDYGVFAIALFCPDCGAPNISLHFRREVELVDQQVTLAEGLGKDRQELAYRLLGNAHEDVLTAFEATLKTVHRHGMPGGKPVGNDFQNIEKGQRRFAELTIDPCSALTGPELERLQLNIQKRHVVGHNLGLVDAKFAQTAGDAKLGETVKLVGADIREFAGLCRKVINWLDAWLGGQMPQPAGEVDPADEGVAKDMGNQIGDLTQLATAIGTWICRNSILGLPEPVPSDALIAAFPDNSDVDLAGAIAELESEGLVTATHTFGPGIPRVHSTSDLFLTFDPPVLGSEPLVDVVALGRLVLDGRESVGVADLHAESGLPLRRFNPAIAMIIAQVGDGRVSDENGVFDYPARHFHLIAEDRVALRRLLKQLQE